MRELDVKNILQSNVKTRFLFSAQLNRQQKVLFKYQKANLIESQDNTESSDCQI